MSVRTKRRLAAALLGLALSVGMVACSGDTSSGKDRKKASSTASAPRLPLAAPNVAGPQPTQVDPNVVYPCDVTEGADALRLVPNAEQYTMQFRRGGWCSFGPENMGRDKTPLFSILYEGHKGDYQVGVNFGDAQEYVRENVERRYGSTKSLRVEKTSPVNTDRNAGGLYSVGQLKGERRYVAVIVTTLPAPRMTLLLYFHSPLTHKEAQHLAARATAAAFQAGLPLRHG